MSFLRTDDLGRNVYSFDCPRCHASGEIALPADCLFVQHDCGVLFKQVQNRHYGHDLQTFVLDKHFGQA